jgi:hypothetical protein
VASPQTSWLSIRSSGPDCLTARSRQRAVVCSGGLNGYRPVRILNQLATDIAYRRARRTRLLGSLRELDSWCRSWCEMGLTGGGGGYLGGARYKRSHRQRPESNRTAPLIIPRSRFESRPVHIRSPRTLRSSEVTFRSVRGPYVRFGVAHSHYSWSASCSHAVTPTYCPSVANSDRAVYAD